MVTPTIFLLAINCKNKKDVLYLILLELQKRTNRQMLCEGHTFGRFLRFFNNAYLIYWYLVIFKSLRHSKRLNKGNFTLKSYSNNMMLCGGGGNIILF